MKILKGWLKFNEGSYMPYISDDENPFMRSEYNYNDDINENIGNYNVGDRVKISPSNDNDSYDDFRDKILIITHKATNTDEHPGFDEGLLGIDALYDFETEDGEDVPYSLYDYELVPA